MTASLVTVRNAVYTAIASARDAGEFAVGDDTYTLPYAGFLVERSHLPVIEIVDFAAEGQLWVVALAWRTGNSESRSSIRKRDLPIQIAYQEPVDKNASGYFDLMDARIELVELIDLLVAKLKIPGYAFLENVPLRDKDAGPDALPFTFAGLRKANTFESYFTSWWREIV